MSYWFGWISRLWGVVLAALATALLLPTAAQAADFRDPVAQQFLVWPNIPVVKAADLDEYAADRKLFADLHGASGDPATILAALQAVDALQLHHASRAGNELGRSLNAQVLGEIDRLTRNINTRTPKLRFEFASITPAELQRPAALDTKALDALKAKASQITLVGYMTYTPLGGSFVQLTGTLVKLSNGDSQSFTVTGPVTQIGAALALEWFNYFYSNRLASHANPMPRSEWMNAAPSHVNQLVSLDMARRYCQSQNADLPGVEDMEMGETSGPYHGGIELKKDALYHLNSGMYYSSEPQLESRIRPNLNPLGSNAYYYCIRHPKPVMAAPAKARVKAAAKAPAKAKAKASTKAAAKKDAAKTPAKAAAKAPAN
ncbi:MAG: hypothetical protein KA309_09645 [Giesbergeria sp.]|nr:hypothetical protein [Giesbergeria sp.]